MENLKQCPGVTASAPKNVTDFPCALVPGTCFLSCVKAFGTKKGVGEKTEISMLVG